MILRGKAFSKFYVIFVKWGTNTTPSPTQGRSNFLLRCRTKWVHYWLFQVPPTPWPNTFVQCTHCTTKDNNPSDGQLRVESVYIGPQNGEVSNIKISYVFPNISLSPGPEFPEVVKKMTFSVSLCTISPNLSSSFLTDCLMQCSIYSVAGLWLMVSSDTTWECSLNPVPFILRLTSLKRQREIHWPYLNGLEKSTSHILLNL